MTINDDDFISSKRHFCYYRPFEYKFSLNPLELKWVLFKVNNEISEINLKFMLRMMEKY